MRMAGLALLVGALALGAGCAGKMTTIHTAPDFDPAMLREAPVAIGGFVTSSRLLADPSQEAPGPMDTGDHLAQSDAWSPLLYGQFLTHASAVNVWPWSQVESRVAVAPLAAAHGALARGGLLRDAQLADIAAALPEVRYLALARLDGNEVTLHSSTEQAARTSWERDGVENDEARDRSLSTRRRVTVTLDLYDLATGRSVWTATVEQVATELYNFEKAEAGKRVGASGTTTPGITVQGTPRQGPPLDGVLEKACGRLVERLMED